MEDRRYVTRDQYDGRNQVVDERFARDKERIDSQEEDMRKVQALTIEMALLNKKHDEQIDKHEQRITRLERQPADQYGKIKTSVVTAIVSGAVGYAISAIVASIKP